MKLLEIHNNADVTGPFQHAIFKEYYLGYQWPFRTIHVVNVDSGESTCQLYANWEIMPESLDGFVVFEKYGQRRVRTFVDYFHNKLCKHCNRSKDLNTQVFLDQVRQLADSTRLLKAVS